MHKAIDITNSFPKCGPLGHEKLRFMDKSILFILCFYLFPYGGGLSAVRLSMLLIYMSGLIYLFNTKYNPRSKGSNGGVIQIYEIYVFSFKAQNPMIFLLVCISI